MMAVGLLLVFIAALGLLPVVYLQRSRRRWQWAIRDTGVVAHGVVVSVTAKQRSSGRYTGWSELTFEFPCTEDAAPVRARVWVRSDSLDHERYQPGRLLVIRHSPHIPSEAVPEGLDCRPP